MKKLLWVGDAACPSGFALATHKILDSVKDAFNVTVLGMNYRGDPHNWPYPIYAASPGGDAMGIGRLIEVCDLVAPDIIVLQNDGWNLQPYIRQLRMKLPNGEYAFPEHAARKVVAAVAVDGKNFQAEWLTGVSHAIFWTEFALNEARISGYKGSASVIPLGVDLTVFYPDDKIEARRRIFGDVPESHRSVLESAFFVGNVNRNQPRKRWDLTIRYFANWINSRGIRDAYLFLHSAPTGDISCDVRQLAKYYGVFDRLALREPPIWYGVSDQDLRDTYNCFDVQISTTQGEGFGLTTFEGMACCIPQIAPDWSSLGEIAKDAAWLVPCRTTAITYAPMSPNVLGGIADEELFIAALDTLYRDSQLRFRYGQKGMRRVEETRYNWSNIGKQYVDVLSLLTATEEPVLA